MEDVQEVDEENFDEQECQSRERAARLIQGGFRGRKARDQAGRKSKFKSAPSATQTDEDVSDGREKFKSAPAATSPDEVSSTIRLHTPPSKQTVVSNTPEKVEIPRHRKTTSFAFGRAKTTGSQAPRSKSISMPQRETKEERRHRRASSADEVHDLKKQIEGNEQEFTNATLMVQKHWRRMQDCRHVALIRMVFSEARKSHMARNTYQRRLSGTVDEQEVEASQAPEVEASKAPAVEASSQAPTQEPAAPSTAKRMSSAFKKLNIGSRWKSIQQEICTDIASAVKKCMKAYRSLGFMKVDPAIRERTNKIRQRLKAVERISLIGGGHRWWRSLQGDGGNIEEAPQGESEGDLWHCPAGHELLVLEIPSDRFSCSKCKVDFPQGTKVHCCRRCNYDICDRCRLNPKAKIKDVPEAQHDESHETSPQMQKEMEEKVKAASDLQKLDDNELYAADKAARKIQEIWSKGVLRKLKNRTKMIMRVNTLTRTGRFSSNESRGSDSFRSNDSSEGRHTDEPNTDAATTRPDAHMDGDSTAESTSAPSSPSFQKSKSKSWDKVRSRMEQVKGRLERLQELADEERRIEQATERQVRAASMRALKFILGEGKPSPPISEEEKAERRRRREQEREENRRRISFVNFLNAQARMEEEACNQEQAQDMGKSQTEPTARSSLWQKARLRSRLATIRPRKAPEPGRSITFKIVLDGEDVGLDVGLSRTPLTDAEHEHGPNAMELIVVDVKPGAVQQWNMRRGGDIKVHRGDRLVKINGEGDWKTMLKILSSPTVNELEIELEIRTMRQAADALGVVAPIPRKPVRRLKTMDVPPRKSQHLDDQAPRLTLVGVEGESEEADEAANRSQAPSEGSTAAHGEGGPSAEEQAAPDEPQDQEPARGGIPEGWQQARAPPISDEEQEGKFREQKREQDMRREEEHREQKRRREEEERRRILQEQEEKLVRAREERERAEKRRLEEEKRCVEANLHNAQVVDAIRSVAYSPADAEAQDATDPSTFTTMLFEPGGLVVPHIIGERAPLPGWLSPHLFGPCLRETICALSASDATTLLYELQQCEGGKAYQDVELWDQLRRACAAKGGLGLWSALLAGAVRIAESPDAADLYPAPLWALWQVGVAALYKERKRVVDFMAGWCVGSVNADWGRQLVRLEEALGWCSQNLDAMRSRSGHLASWQQPMSTTGAEFALSHAHAAAAMAATVRLPAGRASRWATMRSGLREEVRGLMAERSEQALGVQQSERELLKVKRELQESTISSIGLRKPPKSNLRREQAAAARREKAVTAAAADGQLLSFDAWRNLAGDVDVQLGLGTPRYGGCGKNRSARQRHMKLSMQQLRV